jgi:hypothetical protein
MNLTTNDKKKIIDLIDKKITNPNYELEIRLFGNMFNNTFNNVNLTYLEFNRVLKYLIFSTKNNGLGLSFEQATTLDINIPDIDQRVILKDKDEIKKYWLYDSLLETIKYEVLTKKLIENNDIADYSIRISLSEEINEDTLKSEIDTKNKFFRYKNRYMVYSDDKNFRYDFSEVRHAKNTSINKSHVFKEKYNYEIEIEYIGDLDDSSVIYNLLLENIQLLLNLYQNSYYLISNTIYNDILAEYQNLVKSNRFIAANPVSLQLINIVKTNTHINILNNYAVTYKADGERNFLIVTTNGVLYLINNNLSIKALNITNTEFKNSLFEIEFIEDHNLILIYDVLFSKDKDIRNNPLIGKDGRLEDIDDFLKSNSKDTIYKLENKKYESSDDIFKSVDALLKLQKDVEFKIDGLIFSPISNNYPINGGTWEYLFKWKPPKYNSIDFLIEIVKENGEDIIMPYKDKDEIKQYKKVMLKVSGYREKYNNNLKKREKKCMPVNFKPYGEEEQFANIPIENNKIYSYENDVKELINDDTIVEFIYDKDETNPLFKWKAIRVRYDKTLKYRNGETMYGNFEKVANNVWKSIVNPITEYIIKTGLIEDNISNIESKYVDDYYSIDNANSDPSKRLSYQKFHTLFIKRNLIKNTVTKLKKSNGEVMLFDVGFGKLGDLPSWKSSKIGTIFGIDNSSNNLENSLEIYKETPDPKPIINLALGDFTKLIYPDFNVSTNSNYDDIYKEHLLSKYQFDIVSSNFSLTYFYENDITLKTFFQNVSDLLKIDGYLIGTVIDAEKVIGLIKTKKSIEGKIKNKVIWKIEKKYRVSKFNFDKPLFGKKINVFVSSIGKQFEENLVNMKYLIEMAKTYELELIENKAFEDLYKDMEKSKEYNNIVSEMTDVEKEFSFLNTQFIFKKTKHASPQLFNKLHNKLKKNALNQKISNDSKPKPKPQPTNESKTTINENTNDENTNSNTNNDSDSE